MILWLNGTFGVGKTTTSRCIAEVSAEWHPFDPEWVGYMLRANLDGVPFDDFQDLAAWRRLVPHVIGSGRESHLGVLPHDFDGDGDLDVVSIAYNDDRQIHLWRNDNTTLVTSRAGTA